MNVLELKGSIINFVKSPEEFEAYDDNYTLTLEQESALDEAIKQTYDPSQLVPHEEVIKKMRQWLKE
jgi:hypothetical protein